MFCCPMFMSCFLEDILFLVVCVASASVLQVPSFSSLPRTYLPPAFSASRTCILSPLLFCFDSLTNSSLFLHWVDSSLFISFIFHSFYLHLLVCCVPFSVLFVALFPWKLGHWLNLIRLQPFSNFFLFFYFSVQMKQWFAKWPKEQNSLMSSYLVVQTQISFPPRAL